MTVQSDGGLFGVFTSSSNPAATNDPNIRGSVFIPGHGDTNTNHSILPSDSAGAQTNPDVAALDNGRFVTVWEDGTQVLFRFSSVTFGQFGPDPDATFLHHLGTNAFVAVGWRPAVAALPGGKFVVLWYNDGGGSPNRILGRVHDSDGNSLGDFVAATNVDRNAGVDRDIAVTVRPNGEFVVAWTGLAGTNTVDTSGSYIDAAVFNSKVLPGTSGFTVLTSIATQGNASLTAITTGNQFDPSVAALADGRYVLGWTDASASADDASELAVRGRIIDVRTNSVTVDGTPGHDNYIGTEFNDNLRGFGGADKLTGAAGNDTLDGGAGDDLLILGNGSDVVVYAPGYGADAIEDLATAEGDKIDLRAVPTVHVLADVLARANQVGDDTVIDFGAGDTLTLKFVSKANLTAGNFLLSNAAPVITSNGAGAAAAVSMAENSTQVTTVTASVSDLPTTLTYSITGGADAAKFKIGAATGALAFIAAPDFEAPGDSDASNSYEVRVTVTDGDLRIRRPSRSTSPT